MKFQRLETSEDVAENNNDADQAKQHCHLPRASRVIGCVGQETNLSESS